MIRPGTIAAVAALALVAPPAWAGPVTVTEDGTTSLPALDVPSSALMSPEGNASRVEHILTERGLSGRSTAEANAALFGPRLERMKAAYPAVTIRDATLGGVHVRIYETAGAPKAPVLINVHGGGFVGCFAECGGMESIPVAALTGFRVISIDYRLAPAAAFPAASQDVEAVYREVLKATKPERIGLYGCSAGGLLTAQSLAWFQRKGLPRPAAAGIFCAGGDPAMGGDSRVLGMLLGDGEAPRPPTPGGGPPLGYMRGAAADDATAYPARDAATLAKFPPTLVISATRDFAMSSAVSLHAKLVADGVDARLHLWEGGRHAFFYDVRVPEAREAYQVMARFFSDRLH